MLQFIRSKTGSFLVKLLFILLIMSFGVWGIGDFLRGATGGDATPITVGDQKIDANEVQTGVRRALDGARRTFGATLDMAQARQIGIVDRAVDQIVASALLDQEANRLSLAIGDKQIARDLAEQPMFKGPTGQFDRATFVGLLRSNGMTESSYLSLLRRGLPRQILADIPISAAEAPKALTDEVFRIRNERRIADWVFLTAAAVANIPAPGAEALKDYYDKHPAAFTAPEYRGFSALILQPSDVAAQALVTPDQIKDAYQQRLDEFTTIEKRHVLQLLLPDEATAKQAEAALAKGLAFAEAATSIAKQAVETVDLGTVAKTELPTELGEAAFTAKLNEPTAPVQSVLGWHILKVTEIQPGHVESLEQATPKIEADLRKDAESDALYKLSNKVEDAVAAGAELSAIAQQFNLKLFTTGAIDHDGKAPDGKPVPDLPLAPETLLKPVFDTARGQTSGMQESSDTGAFFVVKVDSVTLPALKPFDAVTDQVRDSWIAEQRTHLVADQAKQLADAVKPEMPLAKLAAQRKLTPQTTKPFTRANLQGDAPIPSGLVADLFKLAPGGVATAASPDGQYVAQLKEIRPADPVADATVLDKLSQTLTQQEGNELLQEFTDALKRRFPVTINRARLDQVLGGTSE